MVTLPGYDVFWQAYPDYIYFASADVKKDIGGAVDDTWITNTCAVRMSRGLNYSGVPVPASFKGMHTVKGGDGRRYAYRVAEMRKWFASEFPTPDLDLRKTRGDAADLSELGKRKGLMALDIAFNDATGHLDLWDGSTITTEAQASKGYLKMATRITLWVLK